MMQKYSAYIAIIWTIFLIVNVCTQYNYCAVNVYVLDIWQYIMRRWWFPVCHTKNKNLLLGQVPVVQYPPN